MSVVLGVLLTLASAWGPGLWNLRPDWLRFRLGPIPPNVSYPYTMKWESRVYGNVWKSHWGLAWSGFLHKPEEPTAEEVDAIAQDAP